MQQEQISLVREIINGVYRLGMTFPNGSPQAVALRFISDSLALSMDDYIDGDSSLSPNGGEPEKFPGYKPTEGLFPLDERQPAPPAETTGATMSTATPE